MVVNIAKLLLFLSFFKSVLSRIFIPVKALQVLDTNNRKNAL